MPLKRKDLKTQVSDLKIAWKESRAALRETEDRLAAIVRVSDFEAAMRLIAEQIDAEIAEAASIPARQWSLVAIRREVKGLLGD